MARILTRLAVSLTISTANLASCSSVNFPEVRSDHNSANWNRVAAITYLGHLA